MPPPGCEAFLPPPQLPVVDVMAAVGVGQIPLDDVPDAADPASRRGVMGPGDDFQRVWPEMA